MECAAGVAAVASVAGKTTFDYNRENFHYDRELRQKKELQTLKYRVCQARQWRADIRDLISLTEYKMHIYLLVNVLLLAFAVTLWCEGRLPQGTPPWMMLGMSIATAAAFTFLLLSIWFAMHAAVAAQSFEVRLLTQMVRLPIPSWQEVEACRTYGSAFEQVEAKQMFRVPFVMGRQEQMVLRSDRSRQPARGVPAPGAQIGSIPEAPADPWGLEGTGEQIPELGCPTSSDVGKCRHVKLALKAAIHWQSYDAFARISMSIGVNQLLLAIAYYLLGYIFVEVGVRSSAFLGVAVLVIMQEALTRLDMSLSAWQLHIVQFLLFVGPLFTCLASYFWSRGTDRGLDIAGGLIPFAFLCHGLYILTMTRMCRIQEQSNGAMLPMALGSVLFLDVFGHMKSEDIDSEDSEDVILGPRLMSLSQQSRATSSGNLASMAEGQQAPDDAAERMSRPGLQAVQYDHGAPVATRPENASSAPQDMRCEEGAPSMRSREGDFYESSLFMPRTMLPEGLEVDEEDNTNPAMYVTGHEHEQPGFLPWRVFRAAMLLLSLAWLFAAVYAGLNAARVWTLEIPFSEDSLGDLGVDSGYEVTPGNESHREGTEEHVSLLATMVKSGVVRSEGHLHSLWKSVVMGAEEVLGGSVEELDVRWPEMVGAPGPMSLSCDAAGQHFVASNGLLTWSAELREEAPGAGMFLQRPWSASATFTEVKCPGLAGEAVQDVGLHCSASTSGCRAWLLHRQGKRLTSCDVSTLADDGTASPAAAPPQRRRLNVSVSWLEHLRVAGQGLVVAETPRTFALNPKCGEAQWCGFLGTSSGRVVRAEHSAGNEIAPTDMVHEHHEDMDSNAALQAGPLRRFNQRYVGVLQQDRQSLQVLNAASGGVSAGRVVLPAGIQASGFCVGGGFAYFLSSWPSPRLWRLRLPTRLQPN
mmetsp:Transcript_67341/g.161457  ORF Transcript_67341/g.161457 Transcript_67341/m.161457 type:complete len:922 (-) Transcript_67341:110-2875(-)